MLPWLVVLQGRASCARARRRSYRLHEETYSCGFELGCNVMLQLMAQHAVVATKMNLKLSGSAVSTAPSHVQKKVS